MHAWEIIIGIYANLDTLNPGFWLISDPFSIIIFLSLLFFLRNHYYTRIKKRI